jgi:hypothetical protein
MTRRYSDVEPAAGCVQIAAGRWPNYLRHKKKGPEPKFEAFSPDGYSGGKGGAARLKRTGQ